MVQASYHGAEMFMDAPTSPGAFEQTFQAPFQPSPNDVFIALMGMTGAGKSTFISHCTEEEVRISDPGALESCTQEVRVHRCKHFSPFNNVYLVDTPGFDDTNRKDTDILKEIAGWLTETYKEKIKLRGILYLHRISDNRMGGCAQKNLVMFKRLCGPEGINNVTFVTTHWEKVDQAEGERRESTLQSTKEFWGFFVDKGATIRRHENNSDSALYIVEQFVPGWSSRTPDEVKLAIQTEMVDSGKDLNNTAAGQELQDSFAKERERMQQEMKERDLEMREAMKARDKEMLNFLREEQENQRVELRRRNKEMDELKISMERMHAEKVRKLEVRLQQQHKEHLDYRQSAQRRDEEHFAKMDRMQAEQASERNRQENMLHGLKSQVNELRRRSPQPQPVYTSNKPAGRTVQDNFAKYRHKSYLTCLTCGDDFNTRDGLFAHLRAYQHGRDIRTGRPERV
ncbi:hypothetical protein FSARC_11849 [Fusarium sarcochroum]|uniref:C2H2-type domain-containing protein n=1 Tax=Fusarium sarcochroum TaxID=1208366 RepID=A0A8H4TCJ5_9HYPO|nr:hypothetical protein FSARC_11849 [Fusarium sarcochroum]